MKLLTLDPSTAITGAAIAEVTTGGLRLISACLVAAPKDSALKGNADAKRIQRIAHIRQGLEEWLSTQPPIEAIAYEFHTGRGQAASEAIPQATGAYLTISGLPGCPIRRIFANTAKAAWGGTQLCADETKPAVIAWARREFAGAIEDGRIAPIGDGDDAIADALAVLVAAWGQIRQEAITGPVKKKRSPRK